jgi:pyridoxamine 5'-phosphate oxidase
MPDTTQPNPDPFAFFATWMAEAEASEPEANAMTLATTGPDGQPEARIVLLKGADARGFVFFTNKQSHKADQIAASGKAGLLFFWKSLGRQIRVTGTIEHVTDAESDAYFATRPRISRLGAWASDQSRPLPSRAALEQRLAVFEQTYPTDEIPRPAHWGGYRLLPRRFEFWRNMPFRLHDRTIYTPLDSGGWAIGKLFP